MAAVRVDELEQVYREVCSGYGRLLQLVAKADEEQDGLLLGCTGTAALLVSRLRVTRTVAAGMVSEARGLRRCPETLARLADGRIDPGHLRQILAGVKAVAHVPEGPEKAEEILLALALEQDAGAVKIAAAGITQALDPIGVEREHRARRERSVCYLSPTLDGMWNLAGTLDAESGAMVATALDALSTGYLHAEEEPATEQASQAERKDRLSGPQRRALALADLAARALTAGEVGVHGGTRPHLSVLIPEQVLTDAPTPSIATAATTAYGQALPPSSAHRLVCDASLTPIQIDGEGLPLKVGRTKRLATTAQRKALAIRDKGCMHPGCRIGPQWCDAHHIVSWLDGGATDLDNLILLCRRHHTDVHYEQRIAALTGQSAPAVELALAC